MNTESKAPSGAVIDTMLYAVTWPSGRSSTKAQVTLRHIPMGSQLPERTRYMSLSLLQLLIDTGDAVIIDSGQMDSAGGQATRWRTHCGTSGFHAGPSEQAAPEKVLTIFDSDDLRFPDTSIEHDDMLETV